ncbi:MAG TPA: MlaD family protein [Solirubrobacteraceae bacterium]|jgi:phospholipid/cholesterol/gamma-HCH transport system substrate-binding protein|nr:MlaD family protein [Solirubrobacteraceae bacterium]
MSTEDMPGAGPEREAIPGAGPEGGQEPRPGPGRNGARVNGSHEGGRGMRDQIERYRTAFAAVVVIIVFAALTGGFVLAHERLAVPTWFPVIGHEHFTLKAEFQTAQAVIPGQGQAVTIAGAKIGEIQSVSLHEGRALVSMNLTPKYARYIYRNATMLLRPKTQLKDMTVEVDPGTPSAGRVPGGEIIPISQTAPDVNLDEFLSALDADTRNYVQLLLAGASQGLKGNSRNLSAAFKRFDPLAREGAKLTRLTAARHANIARAIHNFKIFIEALGSKDKALSEFVDSANAALGAFAQQDQSVQAALRELPAALRQTNQGLGKLATAASVAGPTLQKLEPFAKALGPAQQQAQPFLRKTTPITKNEIRPFTREIEPVLSEIQPDVQQLAEAFPGLTTSVSVLNEFFNELAYNPGANQAGFLFYLSWFNHNVNSVFANADANGPVGNGLLFYACPQLFALHAAEEVNPTVQALSGLTHPPVSTIGKCPAPSGGGVSNPAELSGRVFGKSLGSTFGLGGTP